MSTYTSTAKTLMARMTGRCANGFELDGGRLVHAVNSEPHTLGWQKALCGAKPGRRSGGWVEVLGAHDPTCPRCAKKVFP